MKMKKIAFIVLMCTATACNSNLHTQDQPAQKNSDSKKIQQADAKTSETSPSFENALHFANYCVANLQENKPLVMQPFVKNKILFSPSVFIDTSTCVQLTLEELSGNNSQQYTWGRNANSGNNIQLNVTDYFKKYVFPFNPNDTVTQVNIYKNEGVKRRGTQKPNIRTIYPNATIVEYYYPPSKDGWMDWKSLYLVIQQKEDHYYLNAIVHSQWGA